MIPSPLYWFGGKFNTIRTYHIHEFFPPMTDHYHVFGEFFAGGFSMFLNVPCVSAVLNDLDENIYNFLLVLTTPSLYQAFDEKITRMFMGKQFFEVSKANVKNPYLYLSPDQILKIKEFFQKISNHSPLSALDYTFAEEMTTIFTKLNDEQDTLVNRVIAFYLQNRNRFSGLPIRTPEEEQQWFERMTPKPFYKDFSLWKAKFDACRYLEIKHMDALELLALTNRYTISDRRRYSIYLDPPYITAGHNYSVHPTDDSFHEQLAQLVIESPHQILVSYDYTDKTRDKIDSWYEPLLKKQQCQILNDLHYYSNSESTENTEILISNQPLIRYTKSKSLDTFFKIQKKEK